MKEENYSLVTLVDGEIAAQHLDFFSFSIFVRSNQEKLALSSSILSLSGISLHFSRERSSAG